MYLQKQPKHNRRFVKKLIILSIIVYILNILLILQLIPVLESQTFGAKTINLLVSPPNFIFEDLLGISSVKIIDYLTWILQFFYDFLIVLILLKLFRK
ncbi:MAG: hypothetical protein AABW90_01220 [Nanoarchaeota archaeon]